MAVTVGFIGLGVMGKPMARHLLGAGYPLVVHNRSRGAVDELVDEGATAADDPRAVAERADVVITMLPDTPDVEAVVTGEDGVLAGAGEGMLLIDMSTISPIAARELAAEAASRGVAMLDAPVSGGEAGAVAARLSIMAGGKPEDFERARPLFEALGKPLLVGPPGAGQIVKACNQIVVALNIEALGEALVLGSKAGVDPARILDALEPGLAGSAVMKAKRENLLGHDFTPGFRVDLHRKDLGIALETARRYGSSAPVAALVDQMLGQLQAKGHGSADHSSLLTVIEDASQHRIGAGDGEDGA
jgi:2-hydroxy-3-oxopropionate reductase